LQINLIDTRRQRRDLRPLVSLLRQSIYSRLAGYDDVNDADVLRHDPVMRQLVDGQAIDSAAAFAEPGLLDTLESENISYAIRLKANARLNEEVAHLTTRPVGRPSIEPKIIYHSFDYQARSWNQSRRVVAKITFFVDQLFPQIGFIVTNLNWKPKAVINFYNKRGTCEQWIKEGKYAFNWTKLSCQSFAANQARLQLFALAYNLANQMRLRLPKPVANWSLTKLKHKLIKLGARFICHARYHIFQCAQAVMPSGVFAAIVGNLSNIHVDTG
jgi:hypothetical protein